MNPGGGLSRDRRGVPDCLRPPFESVVIQPQPLRDGADTMSAGQRRRQQPTAERVSAFHAERDFRQTSSRRRASSISNENDRFDFIAVSTTFCCSRA